MKIGGLERGAKKWSKPWFWTLSGTNLDVNTTVFGINEVVKTPHLDPLFGPFLSMPVVQMGLKRASKASLLDESPDPQDGHVPNAEV